LPAEPKFKQICRYITEELSKNPSLDVKGHIDIEGRPDYCYIDFSCKSMKEKYGERAQITSSIFVGRHVVDGNEKTTISTDIDIPMCPTKLDDDFIIGPMYYNLCSEPSPTGPVGCKLDQMHLHTGTLPTAHTHIVCDVEDFPNQWHCIGKLAAFAEKVMKFSKRTCIDELLDPQRAYLPYGLTEEEKASPELQQKLSSCIKDVEEKSCPQGFTTYDVCSVNPVAICRSSLEKK
jgi:hypothetical protein